MLMNVLVEGTLCEYKQQSAKCAILIPVVKRTLSISLRLQVWSI